MAQLSAKHLDPNNKRIPENPKMGNTATKEQGCIAENRLLLREIWPKIDAKSLLYFQIIPFKFCLKIYAPLQNYSVNRDLREKNN